jgi:serine/threonine-protein kinase RsbW
MAGNPNVRLRFVNRPENVLLVRQTLNGLADTLGINALELNDVVTAVTEACNNVVLHAYRGKEGPLEVELSAHESGLDVLVRDRGIGIRERTPAPEQPVSGGIGLPVIHALADHVELRDIAGGGTEVEMHFATSSGRGFTSPPDAPGEQPDDGQGPSFSDTALMTVAPTPVAESVLPRLLSALAARAFFPVDRISDAQELAVILLGHVDGFLSGGHLTIAIKAEPHQLELRIGPLTRGRAGELFSDAPDAELSPLLERLRVGHEVALGSPSPTRGAAGGSETLAVRLAGRSG